MSNETLQMIKGVKSLIASYGQTECEAWKRQMNHCNSFVLDSTTKQRTEAESKSAIKHM